MLNNSYKVLVWIAAFMLSTPVFSATSDSSSVGKEVDMSEMIMHHVKDAHEWHILTYTNGDGEKQDVSVYLPVILIDGGLEMFSSKELYHHGQVMEVQNPEADYDHYISNAELGYALYNEKIYKLNAKGTMSFNAEGKPTNVKPLDFSITKNVFSLFVAGILMFVIMRSAAASYKKGGDYVPKGLARFVEPIVIFIRDEVAIANFGEEKYKKYLPYLLNIFFFIWITSLMGLIPIIPGGANLTGNISFTLALALFTLIFTLFSAKKHYWGHIFRPPGVPIALYPIMIPIEIVGVFTKPFALTVRLFANMTAGHIIVLALIGIIFTFGSVAWSGLSLPMALFISVLELLVGMLQAFIFTVLSALFIGEAVREH